MQTLVLKDEMTIFNAIDQKMQMLSFLQSGDELALDLSKVEEIDSAGLQLLIIAKRTALAANKVLRFVRHSKTVLEALTFANLLTGFGDQVTPAQQKASLVNIDADMREALATFTLESRELLQEMEDGLMVLDDDASAEQVNALFRAAHTIKGSSGLFGLEHIVKFTHVVESVLDLLRAGKVAVSRDLVAVLLPCCDHLSLLIRGIIDGNYEEDPEQTRSGAALHAALALFLDGGQVNVERLPTIEGQTQGVNLEDTNWQVSLRFGADSLRDGMEPLSFIRYLATLGEVVHLTTLSEYLPELARFDPETCYLGFEIHFKSQASQAEIEHVFEFVRESSAIRVLPLHGEIDDCIKSSDTSSGELLVHTGTTPQPEAVEAVPAPKQASDGLAGVADILVEQHAVQEADTGAALENKKQAGVSKANEKQSMRVDAERLDKLIDLIGELVISGAGVNLQAMLLNNDVLLEATASVLRLVEEIRDSALQLRMVPISTTFNRFQRVVRDVGKELGKDIALTITGGDTEVDKSVVEKISDPLMHLVRNAIDHGIESAERRQGHGKSAKGTLRLNAYHGSGNINIEVSDDGGGLDRDCILEKAVEKGLVASGENLTDQQIYALIFSPGFSTAKQVSNLSGRGVGMDVVKSNVEALRGTVEIESQLGLGTTIRIQLPLTLAIIDGFSFNVGESIFVIPLDRVLECVDLTPEAGNRLYMDLRGEVLPLIRLREMFAVEGEPPMRESVVVVEHAGCKAGFIVDQLLGEFQTVIKPLGKLFAHIKGLAGSTILGSGKVALVLDVSNVISLVDCQQTVRTKKLAQPA